MAAFLNRVRKMEALSAKRILDDSFSPVMGDDSALSLAAPFEATAASQVHDARKSYRLVTAGIAFSDALSVTLSLALVHLLNGGSFVIDQIGAAAIFAAVPVAWVAIFMLFGLYAPRHLPAVEEFRRVVGATSFGMVVMVMAGFVSATVLPRSVVGIMWALVLVFELLTRRIWRLDVARRRAEGSLALRTLVIGTNAEARNIYEQLRNRGTGYSPVGFVSAGSTHVLPADLSIVSGIRRLETSIRAHDVECVFVASSAVRSEEMLRVMQIARQAGVDVRISANLPEILASRVAIQSVGNSMALSVRPLQLSRAQTFAKRAFDLVIAGVVLLLTAPLWLMIAAAIKLTSKGPVLFCQVRLTKGGQPFSMMKFRTMMDDWDADALGLDLSSPFFKMENDPRVTSVGRFLRKTSLDELPQLLNVIAGDMSLVGPRPLPQDQVDANPDLLSGRLEVQAGMTGWWQIQGRSDVPAETAVRLDVFYIENWSLSLDLYILLKTFGAVVARAGAV